MSILNDNQIRMRCLTPTHQYSTIQFSKIKDRYFSKADGKSYDFGQDADQRMIGLMVEISKEQQEKHRPMIYPFEVGQVRTRERDGQTEKIVSYGTSSMGYDVRLGRTYKIFTNLFNALVDPLCMPEHSYVDHEGDFVVIPPNSYVLGHTMEYFIMPRDVTAICVGKSTYARAGIGVNVTPIEPGFEGVVVIELANHTNLPVKVHSEMGIAQFIFHRGDPCDVSYADRAGKYQGQTGIQTAIV